LDIQEGRRENQEKEESEYSLGKEDMMFRVRVVDALLKNWKLG